MEFDELSNHVIGCALEVHRELGAGLLESTQGRRPLKLVYYEACLNQEDSLKRERYLKTAYGKRYLKNRLRGYFDGLQ